MWGYYFPKVIRGGETIVICIRDKEGANKARDEGVL